MGEVHKIVVVGIGGVGKSCLTIQYLRGSFVGQYDPTIEESYKKAAEVDGIGCQLEILDTAGQEEYGAIRDKYIRAGEGFLCVYSITSRPSMDELRSFQKKIRRAKDSKNVPLVIVGNKCDLEDLRQVSIDDGRALANEYSAPFYEVSAKEGTNVVDAFELLVREIRKWKLNHDSDSTDSEEERRRRKRKAAKKKKKKSGSGCAIL